MVTGPPRSYLVESPSPEGSFSALASNQEAAFHFFRLAKRSHQLALHRHHLSHSLLQCFLQHRRQGFPTPFRPSQNTLARLRAQRVLLGRMCLQDLRQGGFYGDAGGLPVLSIKNSVSNAPSVSDVTVGIGPSVLWNLRHNGCRLDDFNEFFEDDTEVLTFVAAKCSWYVLP